MIAGECKRLIAAGGVYLNNVRVTDVARSITADDLVDGSMLVVRSGKKTHGIVIAST